MSAQRLLAAWLARPWSVAQMRGAFAQSAVARPDVPGLQTADLAQRVALLAAVFVQWAARPAGQARAAADLARRAAASAVLFAVWSARKVAQPAGRGRAVAVLARPVAFAPTAVSRAASVRPVARLAAPRVFARRVQAARDASRWEEAAALGALQSEVEEAQPAVLRQQVAAVRAWPPAVAQERRLEASARQQAVSPLVRLLVVLPPAPGLVRARFQPAMRQQTELCRPSAGDAACSSENPLEDCCCLELESSRVRLFCRQTNARKRLWFHPPILWYERDTSLSAEMYR